MTTAPEVSHISHYSAPCGWNAPARVATTGIPCGLARTGTYRAAAGPQGERALARYRAFLDAMELPCRVLDRAALEERIGSAYYRRGLYSPHCYLVQPAALVRGRAEM